MSNEIAHSICESNVSPICPTSECEPDQNEDPNLPPIDSESPDHADKKAQPDYALPTNPCEELGCDGRTEYQHSFGCSETCNRDRKRIGENAVQLPDNWLADTTYQSSWRSLAQIRRICDIDWYKPAQLAKSSVAERNAQALKEQLSQLMAGGITEYQHRLSAQADWSLDMGKYGRCRKEGYVDRYTKDVAK